jgi:hypothetical protein
MARGAHYTVGGVIRVRKQWPGGYEAHATSPNGASQLLEAMDAEPSYKV